LALTVQVGFLLHQLSLLADHLADGAAARVVAATTVAALVGRLAFGVLADRFDPFRVTLGYVVVQIVALALLATGASEGWALTATSVAFGLGVGTLVTAPPMLTRRMFPTVPFEVVFFRVNAALMVGAALGPLLTTTLHDGLSGYPPTMAALAGGDVVAFVLLALAQRRAARPRSPAAARATPTLVGRRGSLARLPP
jgi:MFS family permease